MRKLFAPALSITVLAAALSAQTTPIGYPYDTIRLGSGNLVPFGFSSSTNFDEGRWQQLIPSSYLPTAGGVVTGIAVHCQTSSANVVYTSLDVTMSHTQATSLGTSAAANLPLPLPVLNATNLPIQWARYTWVPITFTIPFPYNGVDNLVVSLQKRYDRATNPVPGIVTHQTQSRPDLPIARYVGSSFGSGGSTTDTLSLSSSSLLSIRLLFATPATITIANAVPNTFSGTEFLTGSGVNMSVWGATGTAWGMLLDTGFQPPMSFAFIQGLLLVRPTLLITSGTTAGGMSSFSFTIPPDPTLVNSYWTLQSAVLDPTRTTLAWTNGVDFFVR